MAKHKRSRRRPQARHSKKSKPSQHDKRRRLERPNPTRVATHAADVPLVGWMATIVDSMSQLLDKRVAFRLPILIAGMMLASGRRTVARCLRFAGVKDDWDRFYDLLPTIGKQAATLMLPILWEILKRFDPGEGGYLTIAIDDSPTKRYGRHVEAANIHHNPTPGPGDGDWLYGHNWVCLAMLITHPIFGVMALPLLSQLYVRKVDIPELKFKYDWKFRTKHQLALELCTQVMQSIRAVGRETRFVVVFDGAYAAGALIRPLIDQGAIVVTRLRRDALLFDLPVKQPGRRGRPRKYGSHKISLKRRASNHRGWKTISYCARGMIVQRRYKTFLATSRIVGGPIRVVLLEYSVGNWAAYLSTDLAMDVETILRTVADRWAIEEHFHDTKEIWGAGQQQVRNVWSNIACWNLCGWLYSLVELTCWNDTTDELVDRSDRPWDNPDRRPSHADRRRYITRKMLGETFLTDLPPDPENRKIYQRFEQLLKLAV